MSKTVDPTDLPKVSEVIERLRQDAGLGVGELADRVGVSRESVRKWERGTSVPSSAHAREIAVLCGKNPGYLLQYANWETVDVSDDDGRPQKPDSGRAGQQRVDRVNITSTSGSVVPMLPRRRRKIDGQPLPHHAACSDTDRLRRNAA